jgi:hypothetical protein
VKIFFLLTAFVFSIPVRSQIPYFKELLSFTDTEATQYLDSLNGLKPNPSYKIKRDVDKDGNLTIEAFLSNDGQDLYTCRQIILTFNRVKGVEYCFSQILLGESKYAYRNITHIKDNYMQKSDSSWEHVISNNSKSVFKKVAVFRRYAGDADTKLAPYYEIDYFFDERNKHPSKKH